MADETKNDQEAQRALEQLSTMVTAGQRGLEVPSKQQLCDTYKAAKPLIDKALPWIEKLPRGKQIGDAVRFLETVADAVCK
jgi:hypothetical protein